MGYDLVCKAGGCEVPIHVGDEVVTKSNSEGPGPKFYHSECYEASHLQFRDNGTIMNGLGNIIRQGMGDVAEE